MRMLLTGFKIQPLNTTTEPKNSDVVYDQTLTLLY